MSKVRHTNIIAVFIMLEKDGQYFFLRRANTGYYDGFFTFPCGHVEAGETYTQAAVREVEEEAGVKVKIEDLTFEHVMHRKGLDDNSERVDMYFSTKKWKGEAKNTEPEKCSEVGWFALDQIPSPVPCVEFAGQQILEGNAYSELNWVT